MGSTKGPIQAGSSSTFSVLLYKARVALSEMDASGVEGVLGCSENWGTGRIRATNAKWDQTESGL